jgi:hypothetical protein
MRFPAKPGMPVHPRAAGSRRALDAHERPEPRGSPRLVTDQRSCNPPGADNLALRTPRRGDGLSDNHPTSLSGAVGTRVNLINLRRHTDVTRDSGGRSQLASNLGNPGHRRTGVVISRRPVG